jgi:hypothetical protein
MPADLADYSPNLKAGLKKAGFACVYLRGQRTLRPFRGVGFQRGNLIALQTAEVCATLRTTGVRRLKQIGQRDSSSMEASRDIRYADGTLWFHQK